MWHFACHSDVNGYTLRVNEWDARLYKTSFIMMDGVIAVPTVFEVASICPMGLCECGKCGAFWIATHIDMMYWDNNLQFIVCDDCSEGAIPIMMVTTRHISTLRSDPTVHISFEDVIDETEGHTAARQFASVHNLHYFEGKTAMDIYHETLAKRVARRWRRAVRWSIFKHTAWVMNSCLALDSNTCGGLARRAIAGYC